MKRLPSSANACLALTAAALSLACLATTAPVLAQDAEPATAPVGGTPADEEIPVGMRSTRYAWGEGGAGAGAQQPAVHRFARVYAALGAGISFRLYYDPDGLRQDFLAPAYLQLRGGYFFEGDGDLQHGVGLGIATNLMPDPPDLNVVNGFFELGQWTLAPSYMLRIWLSDEVQLMGAFGVPVALSSSYQSVGLELVLGGIFKLFSGAGLYAQATFSTYFGQFVQPILSIDGGIVLDYEVLP